MASTPSPAPAELPSTPPAPRFGGYYDNWEPYQPRKSARIANRSSNRTPSPTGRRTIDSTASSHKQPSKTNPIPKCRLPSATSAPGATTSSMGSPKSAKKAVKPVVASSSSGMPTPTKTPRKPQSAKQSAELDSVSRDIFNTRSGRTPKKLTGSTLESFEAQELDQDFTIFSDSCNRVPTRDESNPFYDPRPARQTRTQGRRKMVKIPGEGMQPVDKAVGREDGLLMNFRGKTIYRPLANGADEESDGLEDLADGIDVDDSVRQSFSKQKLTPRLLFAKETQDKPELNPEEEEVTDVEDGNMDSEPPSPNTPPRTRKTPNAPKFPASPPSTQRTTRSADRLGAAAKRTTQPVLNYNKWGSVAKSHKSGVTATKRAGEPLGQDAPKRSRTEA